MSEQLSAFLSPDARKALQLELERLQNERDRLREESNHRRAALTQIEAELQHIIEAIQSLSLLLGSPLGAQANAETFLESRSGALPIVSRPGIAEAIDAVFASNNGGELHYKKLSALLQERGVALGGKDPAATLLAFITNAKYASRYVRCGRGTYRLADPIRAEINPTPTDVREPKASPVTRPLRKSRRRRRIQRVKNDG